MAVLRRPAFHDRGANACSERDFVHLRIMKFVEEGYHPFGDGIGGRGLIIIGHLFQVALHKNSVASRPLILNVHAYRGVCSRYRGISILMLFPLVEAAM